MRSKAFSVTPMAASPHTSPNSVQPQGPFSGPSVNGV